MLVHVVLFWLKADLKPEERQHFREGLDSLREIKAAEAVYTGLPADTPERPVVDRSYSFGLTVLLQDRAAHDAYQDDPLHQEFVNRFKPYWDRIQIYDIE